MNYSETLNHKLWPTKGGLAGFENVESTQLQLAQEVFAERAKVRAIAKASRRDAHELSAGNE